MILTTVESASSKCWLRSADCTKSSVLMSSTRRSSPVDSSIKEPFVKFVGELILLEFLKFDRFLVRIVAGILGEGYMIYGKKSVGI